MQTFKILGDFCSELASMFALSQAALWLAFKKQCVKILASFSKSTLSIFRHREDICLNWSMTARLQ